MSKLNNIKAVKEMLGGEHKTQTKKTISFTDKVIKRREVKSGNNEKVTKLKLVNYQNSELS